MPDYQMRQQSVITFTGSDTEWIVPDGWSFLNDKPGLCRSCGAPVLWLESKNGKKSPFNADGVNHFATCPQADSWRKK